LFVVVGVTIATSFRSWRLPLQQLQHLLLNACVEHEKKRDKKMLEKGMVDGDPL
jgi:hypothetical protein